MALSGSCAQLGRHEFCRTAVKNLFKSWNGTLSLSPAMGILSRSISEADLDYIMHEGEAQPRQKNMSKAMKAYLQRAREHDEFMRKEAREYEIGRRHLANMMGESPEHFTQENINAAIKYLFPSGIYDKKALPIMDDPQKIFPPRKAAEFDETGRPFSSLFYTTKPNYYQALYDIVEEMEKVNKIEDEEVKLGLHPNKDNKMDLLRSSWLIKEDLEKVFLEPLKDDQYDYFITAAQRLAEHPYSKTSEGLLKKFRKEHLIDTSALVIPPLEYNEQGRPYVYVPICQAKSSYAQVKLWGNGSGQIKINGQDLTYFETLHFREQVIFPLIFTGMDKSIDVEATAQRGGPSGQSGAIRWGIAWGLRSFVDAKMIEKMRIAGLLTKDWRQKERKKPGQEGARRKFKWKKR